MCVFFVCVSFYFTLLDIHMACESVCKEAYSDCVYTLWDVKYVCFAYVTFTCFWLLCRSKAQSIAMACDVISLNLLTFFFVNVRPVWIMSIMCMDLVETALNLFLCIRGYGAYVYIYGGVLYFYAFYVGLTQLTGFIVISDIGL